MDTEGYLLDSTLKGYPSGYSRPHSLPPPPPPPVGAILKQDGFFILKQDGDKILL